MNTFYKYNAKVLRVVDGDTIDATVFLGFNVTMKIRFRLLDFDAPETYRPSSKEEKEAGELATSALKKLIADKDVIIESRKFGKYRYLARIYLSKDSVHSVNEKMIELGHTK
ncbi:MAG: thermonuclease family protein [Methylococcales bacterium]